MSINIAMFLDLDNLLIGADEARLPFEIETIVNTIEERFKGRVVLRRAYGDYRQQHQIPRQLAHAGFQLHSLVRLNSSDKNLADMQMVADAVETLVDGYRFQTYVVVTGDRDFMPLVQVLRRHDKNVIGVGVKHTTSASLISLCDHYIYYDDIVTSIDSAEKGDVREWLNSAANLAFQNSERVQASVFRDFVQQASNGKFSKSAQGKASFSKLLERYPETVQLEREATTLFVAPSADVKAPTLSNHLYLQYRSALKKRGLRVVMPMDRTLVLRDMVLLLQEDDHNFTWQTLINHLAAHYETQKKDISKSVLNDVLRLSRRAGVIEVCSETTDPLATSPISLSISVEKDKLLQEAVMLCDYTYLSELGSITTLPFDLVQVSCALYNSPDHALYLRRLLRHYQ